VLGVRRHRWAPVDDPRFEGLPHGFFSHASFPEATAPSYVPRQALATWAHRRTGESTRDILALGALCSVSVERRSEDAPPLFGFELSGDTRRLLLGVFDGMGGAGSAMVGIDGHEVSGAYAAARLVRQVVERSFWSGHSGSMEARSLAEAMTEELKRRRPSTSDGNAGGVVRGSMIKVLPTTAAVVEGREVAHGRWSLDLRWAGDSRVYVITPEHGLQQLTMDDVEDPDPMNQIRSDQSLQNLISASATFRLNSARVEIAEPFIVLAATDGLFHYLPTPGSLEYVVLRSMQECKDAEDAMAEKLGSCAMEAAHDDVSFALAGVGTTSLLALRALFRNRFAQLGTRGYEELLSGTLVGDRRIDEAERIWGVEQQEYTARMVSNG